MIDFLPEKINKIIRSYGYDTVYEIRIRAGKNICLNLLGQYKEIENTKTTAKEIEYFFQKACSFSIYSYEKSISKGYITTANSERIGLCGEYVYEKGKIIGIKNLTSMVIRIPHQIFGVSKQIQSCLVNGLKNLLIISPPGMGKTTILRDLALYCSDNLEKNVVVIDEKFELYENNFNLGKFTDILQGTTKKDGLIFAVKNLKPDVIVVDEVSSVEDVNELYYALNCGVKIICSAHGKDLEDIKRKNIFKKFFIDEIFDSYIILENIGKIKKYL